MFNFKPGRKILFYDLETTGVDPKFHEVIQISARLGVTTGRGLEIIIRDSFDVRIKPNFPERMDPEASAVNGIKPEDFNKPEYKPSKVAVALFKDFLNRHVDRFDKHDKIIRSGFNNITFDNAFLEELLYANDPELKKFFGSYFYRPSLDIYHFVSVATILGKEFSMFPTDKESGKYKFNLRAFSSRLGVKLANAHDAAADIDAAIECLNVVLNDLVS